MIEEITLCEKGNTPKTYISLDGYYRKKRRKLGMEDNKDRLIVYIEDKELQKTLENRGLHIDKRGEVGILKVLISFNKNISPNIVLHTDEDQAIKLGNLDGVNWFLYKFNRTNPYERNFVSIDVANYWGGYAYHASKEADISTYDDIAIKIKTYDWSMANGSKGTTAYLTELELYNVHLADLKYLSATLILESHGDGHGMIRRYTGENHA